MGWLHSRLVRTLSISTSSIHSDLYRIPFYSWIRLGFLLYLILPQTQGARVLYQTHVDPFLHENELAIDDFISSAHDRAKAAGITYIKHAIELLKQHLLGLPPKEPSPPATPSSYTYAQGLFARFNLPSARPAFPSNPIPGATSTANDFYALLASAVTAATGSTSTQARDLSNSGTLIPPTIDGAERLSFIAAQRERLSVLISALDKEATNLQAEGVRSPASAARMPSMFFDGSSGSDETDREERPKSAMSGLSTRRSEADFEKIDAESGTEEVVGMGRENARRSQSSGSWMPWSWGAKAAVELTSEDTVMGVDEGKSSGVDA